MIKSTFTAMVAALLTILSVLSPAQAQRIPCTQTTLCGQPLFGYARIYILDETGNRVIDNRDHKPYWEGWGFVAYTRSSSGTGNAFEPPSSSRLLTGIRFYQDVPGRTVSITHVQFRHVVRTSDPEGYRLDNSPQRIPFKITPPLVIGLYNSPKEAVTAVVPEDELKWVPSDWWKPIIATVYHWHSSVGGRGEGVEDIERFISRDPRCFSSDPEERSPASNCY